MAILHIVQYSLPEIIAGYTLRTQAVVAHQHRLGWDPVVLTSPRHPRAEPVAVDGVPYLRCEPEAGGASPWLRDFRRVRHLAARICEVVAQRGDIRLLHAHSPVLCGMAAMRAAARTGLPVVYEVRGLWEEALAARRASGPGAGLRYHLARWLETGVCRRAQAVVTISEGLKREFVARGIPAHRIQVVGNGVDLSLFQPTSPPAGWRQDHGLGEGPIILYLGALREYEGVYILARAFPEIKALHPSAHLVVVGGGEEEANLRAALASQADAHLSGPVPHELVRDYYAAADLVVYPRLSTRPTELVTPLKPLEALAMGKPIVASTVGGLRELLDGTGAVSWVPPGDARALARACAHLLSEADLRQEMGRRAREAAAAFTWEQVVARYQGVYEAVAT